MAELDARAEHNMPMFLSASAHRCLAILADRDRMDAHFDYALNLCRRLDLPVDLARTHLAYGERLRRAGRRREVRPICARRSTCARQRRRTVDRPLRGGNCSPLAKTRPPIADEPGWPR